LKTDWGDGKPNYYDELAESVTASHNIDGQMIIATFGGDIWNVNVTNGNTIWYTNTTNLIGPSGIESPFGTWVLWSAFNPMLLDRSCFYATVGHCYNPPLFHGAQMIAINMTNGELVWKYLDFPVMQNAEAYGTLLSYNCYDGQIYAFHKGPSAVTVTAPNIGVTTATPITITGTVMDVSPGTKQSEVALNFPYGLPCVSDESQSKWMECVYQDQPFPADATGVVVTISVEDANGNIYEIGTATTDTTGTFGFTWTPDIPGDYKVIATFAGSNSYYGSSAATHFYASDAPQPTPAPTPQPASAAELYFVPATIGIIIAIAVVGAVLILMLRKR
jgi:outer membrane protein assembly factor BamB